MPRISITDLLDSRLTPYRHLKKQNDTRRGNSFVVEGDKLVERLLKSDFAVESVLLDESQLARFTEIPNDVPVYIIPTGSAQEIVGFNFHRGALACGQLPKQRELSSLLGDGESTVLLVCPNVQNPENLGSIIRTALALGVDGMLLGPASADPFSRRVLRVSMGGSLALPVRNTDSLEHDLVSLRQEFEFEHWATLLDSSATALQSLRARPKRLTIWFGGEGHGIPSGLLPHAQRKVTIPVSERVDSLNVAVAAGIFLHAILQLPVATSAS